MRINKLLTMAILGASLLFTNSVNAKATNSIGYTRFMPPDDGGTTYMFNSEHVSIGTHIGYDEDLMQYTFDKIEDQKLQLPKDTWVSFDVINTTCGMEADTEDLRFFERDLGIEFAGFGDEEYAENGIPDPTDCDVKFTQDGKVLKEFTLKYDKLMDHVSFKFYNTSSSPVIVSTSTDKWFYGDVGYTAHKSVKDIRDGDWSFSFKKKDTFLATPKMGVNKAKTVAILVVTSDMKPIRVKIEQKGKVVYNKIQKSGDSYEVDLHRFADYKLTVYSKSEFFNVITKVSENVKPKKKSNLIFANRNDISKYGPFKFGDSMNVKGKNRRAYFSSSGTGKMTKSVNNGSSYCKQYLVDFNTIDYAHNVTNMYKTNNKYGLKSKGDGWVYGVEYKDYKLVYDRMYFK